MLVGMCRELAVAVFVVFVCVVAACALAPPPFPPRVDLSTAAGREALFRWHAARAEHFIARTERPGDARRHDGERFRRLARRHAVAALKISVPTSEAYVTRAEALHKFVARSSFGIPYPDSPNVHWRLVGPATCAPLFRVLTARLTATGDGTYQGPGKLIAAPRVDATLTFEQCDLLTKDGARRPSQCPTVVGWRPGTCNCPPGLVCPCPRPADVPVVEPRPCEEWPITYHVALRGTLSVVGTAARGGAPRRFELSWTDAATGQALDPKAQARPPYGNTAAPAIVRPGADLADRAANPGIGYVGILEREAAGLAVEAAFARDDDDDRAITCAELDEVFVLRPNPKRLALGAFAAAKARCAAHWTE